MNITDPYVLKEEGLKHIQEYAGEVWTDHNLNDPGIIILEQLCYALADLNYRASFEMEDLLERPDEVKNQLLFTAREILHTQATTANDFRKLLLDIVGVRNAGVVPGSFAEPIYYNQDRSALSTQSWKQEDHDPSDQLHPKGILDLVLSFDVDESGDDLNNNKYIKHLSNVEMIVLELPRWDNSEVDWGNTKNIWEQRISLKWIIEDQERHYHELSGDEKTQAENHSLELVSKHQEVVNKAHLILSEVHRRLHQNRMIAQDFGKIHAIKSEDIGFTSEIAIAGDIDIEALLADLLFRLNRYFNPQIQFKTLDQLMEKGLSSAEIFDGPALNHGFLLDEDLPKQLTNLRTSDLINIMMDVPGIKAIKNFHAATYPEGVLFRSAQRWCVRLNPDINYSPRIAPEHIHLDFFIDGMPATFSWSRAIELYNEKLALLASQKYPSKARLDLPLAHGAFKELDRHYSIQKEFSSNFGIGEEGLSNDAPIQRKAQAQQLKSYLMVFEQLLANHATQLHAIPELFSADPNLTKTLFSQLPEDVPGLESLLAQTKNKEDLLQQSIEIENSIQSLLEKETDFTARRNRQLNHLMARFGEDVSNNALLKDSHDGIREIQNKTELLNQYPELSAFRARGFNYEDDVTVLGSFQKRVYALAGIQSKEWKTLANQSGNSAEGFHLIEHILLRPNPNPVSPSSLIHSSFLPLYDYPEDPWSKDPYSSIVSVVIPNWPTRFKDQQFRDYLERILHLQTPSHVHLLIHWISKKDMQSFESVYVPWSNALKNRHRDPEEYAKVLEKLVVEIKPWFEREKPKTQKPLIPSEGTSITNEDKLWESLQENAKWYQLADGSITQTAFIGTGSQGIAGKGAALAINLTELKEVSIEKVEMIRMRFVPGNEPYSECGLIFDYQSEHEYKKLYYAHHEKKMVLADVHNGETNVLLNSPVKDLSGREVRIEMHAQSGHIQLFQSSKGLIGTEFRLAEQGSLENNRIGFFTRYTQKASFTYLEFIDGEHRELIFRKKPQQSDE